jgi:hypothetical protein
MALLGLGTSPHHIHLTPTTPLKVVRVVSCHVRRVSCRVVSCATRVVCPGKSVGTGPAGITAEVFVVSTFEELTANADKAKGKIVLFNAPFTTYGQTVAFRSRGADAASAVRPCQLALTNQRADCARTTRTTPHDRTHDTRDTIAHARLGRWLPWCVRSRPTRFTRRTPAGSTTPTSRPAFPRPVRSPIRSLFMRVVRCVSCRVVSCRVGRFF